MDFREEYKKSAEIMNPSAESMLRMKQNILEQAKKTPSKKAIPFRQIAIAGGSVAACAVIGISAARFLPQSALTANDAMISSSACMESYCESAENATSAAAGGAMSDMLFDEASDATKNISEGNTDADYDISADDANGFIAPELPTAPMAPEAAEEPAAPDADAATDNADTSPENESTGLKQPEAPMLPELPAEPEEPSLPELPTEPEAPLLPELPIFPAVPEEPTPPMEPDAPEDIVENESDYPLITFDEDLKVCHTDNGTYIFVEILEDGYYPEYDGSLPAEWMQDTTFGASYFVDYTADTLFITNAPTDGRVGVYKKAQADS